MKSTPDRVDTPLREEVALYYPNIEVPETPWFTQVLLYWDKAASIVPHKLPYEEPIPPYTKALHDAGLLEYLDPLAVVNFKVDSFAENFFDLLSRETFLPAMDPKAGCTNVYMEKLDKSVFRELEQRGLAQRFPYDNKWWHIETSTADLYMKYLAGVMSGARPGMLPVTDQVDLLRRLTQPIKPQPTLAELRYAYIQQALPAPSGAVDPAELVKFKEKYADELRRCRRFLDLKLADIASLDDPTDRDLMGNHLIDEVKDEIATLSEQMTRRKWPGVTLKGVCGAGAIGLGAGAAMLAGGAPLVLGVGVGAAICGGFTTIVDAWKDWTAKRYDPKAPLAYAALAHRAFV